jgi:hypothetical protein
LLFALFSVLNPLPDRPDRPDRPDQVRVTEQKIQQLNTIFSQKWHRQATTVELKNMIDEYVLEEMYYREALAMQMDKNDSVVRRRMRQKMEFLMTDMSQSLHPTEVQLQAYLDQHSRDFELDARYSFQQVYLDPDRHHDLEKQINRIGAAIKRGDPVTGDATVLPKTFTNRKSSRIKAVLGEVFVLELSKLEMGLLGKWQGPIGSSYGLHWVKLEKFVAARQPALIDVCAEVEREWRHEFRRKNRAEVNQNLLKKYSLVIDWPARGQETQEVRQNSGQALVDWTKTGE